MLQENNIDTATPIKHRKVAAKLRALPKPTQSRPKTSNVVPISMSRTLRGYLKMMAQSTELSVSEFMRLLIADAIKKWDGRQADKRVTNAYDFGRGLVAQEGMDTSECNVSITLDLDDLERLNRTAHGHGCSRSQYLRMLIVNTLTLFTQDKDEVLNSFIKKNVKVKGE